MKYISCIPLIGGMAIANKIATGKKPEFVLSYDVFANNESHLKNYWPDVEWTILDGETNVLSCEQPDYSDIDFVSSVCPCAGMSMLNKNSDERGADNATNNWLYKSADYILGTIKPKVYFGENAPGLYSDQNVKVINTLREYGRKYGYSFTIYKTDTYLHGIPQHRIRTFFFFWKGDYCPQMDWFNNPNELPFEEWILDKNVGTLTHNIKGDDGYKRYPEMQWIMETRCNGSYEEYIKFFYELQSGKGRVARTPYEYIQHNNLWDEYRAWLINHPNKDLPCHSHGTYTPMQFLDYRENKVRNGLGFFAVQPIVYKDSANAIISKNMLNILHPKEQRYLSTREVMSLMGLPNDFELLKNDIRHVTQNVPVCTAQDMTEQVIKFINGELPMTTYNYIKQNNLTQKVDYTEHLELNIFDNIE